MRRHRKLLNGLALTIGLAIACPLLVSRASAEDMEFEPIPDGGERWKVNTEGFAYVSGNAAAKLDVTRTNTMITYARSDARKGCLLVSPWIPADGKNEVLLFPEFTTDIGYWSKDKDWSWPSPKLFDVYVRIRHPRKPTADNPARYTAETRVFSFTPQDLDWYRSPWRIGNSDGWQHDGIYSSERSATQPLVYRFDTAGQGDLQVMFCNVSRATRLVVWGATVEVLPQD